MSKQNIYDNDLFYENFEKIRSKEINKQLEEGMMEYD